MSIEHLIAFNIAFIAAWLSPGPALLVAMRTSLTAGVRSGFAVGCGLGMMASIWTLMALLGLQSVFQLFPPAYTTIKIMGAFYLMFIAWKTWQGSRLPIEDRVQPARHAFREGFFINLLNPKAMLFAAAVLIVVFPPDLSMLEKTIVVINHLVLEIVFYLMLALFMNTPAVSQWYLRAKCYFDRFAAVVLGALGTRILFEQP